MRHVPTLLRRFAAALLLLPGVLAAQSPARTVDTLLADIDVTAIAVDAEGRLHVAASGRIQRLEANGSLTPVVGNGTPGFAGDGGPPLSARIGRVAAIDFLPGGELVFVDADANRVRRVGAGQVTTIAGNGSAVHSGDDGAATEAGLERPNGLAAGDDGRIYISTGHRIRVVDDGVIRTHVNRSGVAGSNDLDANEPYDVRLDSPEALYFHEDWLYFSDTGNHRILRVSDNSTYAVLGGDWNPGIFEASGIAIDPQYWGIVFTQPGRHWVLKDPHHLANDPYAGSKSVAGFAGDGGPAQDARFSTPTAIAMYGDQVYVADTGNRRVRRIQPTPLPVPPAPLARPWYEAAYVTVQPWTHPEGTQPLHYEVSIDPNGVGYWQVPINDASNVEMSIAAGRPVQFHVRAVYADQRRGPWSPPSATVVADRDQQPMIADVAVLEGNSGTRGMDFVVSVATPPSFDYEFSFSATVSSSASAADFTETIVSDGRIPAGQTSVIVSVPVHGDLLVEGDEDFLVFIGHRGFSAGNARGTIIDDDGAVEPQVAAVDDRFETWENAAARTFDVLDNDLFAAGALSGGRLELVQAPLQGSVSLDAGGTPGNAADDRFVYTPRADWAGSDAFVYRFCVAGGACHEAMASVQVRMFDRLHGDSGHASRLVASRSGLRALSALRFDTTPLRPLVRHLVQMTGDPRPASPWNDDGAGTQTRIGHLPASPTATEWRVFATAAPHSQAATLYLGLDDDGDGEAEAAEVRCVVTVVSGWESCELATTLAAGSDRTYWVMAHNPGNSAYPLELQAGAVPMVSGDGRLVATGPATLAAGEAFQLIAAYDDPSMAAGDRRIGYIRVMSGTDVLDNVPVTTEHSGNYRSPLALQGGVPTTLRLGVDEAQDRMFIDVPEGASSLTASVQSDRAVELYLSVPATLQPPLIQAAPARAQSRASAIGPGGFAILQLSGSQLTPGRWYVTPVNTGTEAATLTVTVDIAGVAPVVRPGSYFDPDRPGHGVFLYPAGNAWAGLWYTYRSDGRATWYYLQGDKPAANGLWTGVLYNSVWQGDANLLVPVGHATVTPRGADAFQFTFELLGLTGSEPMVSFGRGCPSQGGLPVDASSHWFDPRRAGTGYSVQLWDDYEFYAAFVYDRQGIARFLTAESSTFAGADATLTLDQMHGFSPTQPAVATTRFAIGTLRRVLSGGSLVRIALAASYTDGVPGAWTGDDAVQPLGGPGTTQGCEP